MKDNRGYSLVELVIVIAIIAVMSTFIFLGFGLLTGQNARECANDLSAALDKEKNYALTRSAMVDCYLELTYHDNAYYVIYWQPRNAYVRGTSEDDWVKAEEEKIGKGNLTVKYYLPGEDRSQYKDTDHSGHSVKDQSLKFVFDRVSGAYKLFLESDGTPGAMKVTKEDGTTQIKGGTEVSCAGVTVYSARAYDIEIYDATGKHVLTRVD